VGLEPTRGTRISGEGAAPESVLAAPIGNEPALRNKEVSDTILTA